ncbi:MAG: hypothetical protein WBW33_20205 [Bryobacteraceae bacterium]
MMFPLRARRFFRVKRWSAVGLWVCSCLPGLTLAQDGKSDQVSDLILQLQSPQSATKANAAYKLSEIKDPLAGTPLPQPIGTIGPNSLAQATVTVPGSVGAPGTLSQFTSTGTYTGGTAGSGERIWLP